MLYRMRNYFSQKCSCYTDWQPLFRYELYFRDIAAYENEETMRRIFPPAFIVKKRDNYRYVAYPFFLLKMCAICVQNTETKDNLYQRKKQKEKEYHLPVCHVCH